MIKLAKNIWKVQDEAYAKHVKIPRFIIAGGLATVANLGILFLLTHFLHLWYIISAVLAFLLAFFVSFALQKFWTFRDRSKADMHKQAGRFLLIAIMGLTINTVVLYCLVEFGHLHYLVAQFLSGIVIAFFNFFMYQKFIFVKIY